MSFRIVPYDPDRCKERKSLPRELWEKHRAVITDAYLNQNLSLDQVAAYMETEHGFSAKSNMYKHKFKAWKIHKNIPSRVMRMACRKSFENTGRIAFRLGDLPITFEKMSAFEQTQVGFDPASSPTASTPSGLEWSSPTLDPFPPLSPANHFVGATVARNETPLADWWATFMVDESQSPTQIDADGPAPPTSLHSPQIPSPTHGSNSLGSLCSCPRCLELSGWSPNSPRTEALNMANSSIQQLAGFPQSTLNMAQVPTLIDHDMTFDSAYDSDDSETSDISDSSSNFRRLEHLEQLLELTKKQMQDLSEILQKAKYDTKRFYFRINPANDV